MNNEALGRQNPRLAWGWATEGTIPIAWWVIPFIILDDVWRGSDPSIARGSQLAADRRPWAIRAWLATAVIFTVPSAIASSTGDARADEPEKVRQDDILRVIGAVGAIVAAVLAILVTRRIAARQEGVLAGTAPAGYLRRRDVRDERWRSESPGQGDRRAICGIVSLTPCGLVGIVAIVLGNQARGEIGASGGRVEGDGLAAANGGWLPGRTDTLGVTVS